MAAAAAAKAAALAAGHSAAAAQAAEDAVLARPEYDGVCSSCQVGVGETAATAYDYSAIEGASAAIAADTAAKSGDWYAGGIAAGALSDQANQLSQTAVQAHIAGLKAQSILSTIPTAPEVIASLAAGGLTVAAGALALSGAPVIAPILALSGALHAGIIAANIDTSNPLTATTVNRVMAGSVGSSANPFQVKTISKSALSASAAAVSTSEAVASADAAVRVITAPQSDWLWQDATQATHEIAATAAAAAAVAATQSAQPAAVVGQAVNAAAKAAYSGLGSDASAVAAQAAATVSAAGYSTGQAQTAGVQAAAGYSGGLGAASAVQGAVSGVSGLATESTLDKILAALKSPFSDPVGTLGPVPDPEEIAVDSPTFSYTPVVFASAGGCPADVPFNFAIGGHSGGSISFQPLCNFATTMRPLFLAFGAIAAALIFGRVTL